jgi:hypothetical protein
LASVLRGGGITTPEYQGSQIVWRVPSKLDRYANRNEDLDSIRQRVHQNE